MSRQQTVRVFEYDKVVFEAPLSRSVAIQLSQLVDDLKKHFKSDVLEVIYNNNSQIVAVRAKQFVGVIRVNERLTIEILPKMYRGQDASDENVTNIDNLFFMLDYVGQIHTHSQNISQLVTSTGNFYEILVYLYATSLLEVLSNSSHHEYHSFRGNLSFLKGKLLTAKHAVVNSVDKSRFFVEVDDFTADNKLNQVLKDVAFRLLKQSKNTTNKQLLTQIISILNEVKSVHVNFVMANQIKLNRLNTRFEEPLKLAKLFLANETISANAHSFESFTFLIDMNTLFEDFIATALRKSARKHRLRNILMRTQGPVRKLVQFNSKTGKPAFDMKPDIAIMKDGSPSAILDTKYKLLQVDDSRLGIQQADLYQMYAYAHKYSVADITLVYPHVKGILPTQFELDKSCVVNVRTVNLNRKLKNDIQEFEKETLSLIL